MVDLTDVEVLAEDVVNETDDEVDDAEVDSELEVDVELCRRYKSKPSSNASATKGPYRRRRRRWR